MSQIADTGNEEERASFLKENKELSPLDGSETGGGGNSTQRGGRAPATSKPKFSNVDPPPRVSTGGSSPSAYDNDEGCERHKTRFNKRKQTCLWVAVIVLLLSTVILAVVCAYLALRTLPPLQQCTHDDNENVTPRDLKNPDVFDDLTLEEYEAVGLFMLQNEELRLTSWDKAIVNSSYIFAVDLFLPEKHKAVLYLDSGSKKPERQAKVVVVHGNRSPPIVQEYLVYPLPFPKQVKPYKNPSFRRDPIPYESRPMDTIDYKSLFPKIIDKLMVQLQPLMLESYGLSYHNCSHADACLHMYDIAPRGTKSGERQTWVWFFPDVDGYYIHSLGTEILINHNSVDVDEWYVEKLVYNGQMFESADLLMDAYTAGTLKMIHIQNHGEKPLYSSYNMRGRSINNPKQGPKLIEPDGKRFTVKGQHVTYNDWDFNFHMRYSNGLQIHNTKFQGKRIAYEISLQEVLVFYTGYGPAQSGTNYYDVSWLLGASSMELVRGIDCPDTAVFISSYFWANSGKAETFKNNICIFENNGAMPLRRHYANDFAGGYASYGGITDYHLVIRTIPNIWNYDYVLDYIFYTNGAIEVKASATGYVQSTFHLKEEEKYGNVIHDHVVADLHQHLFHYKVDLDIAGEKNRYTTVDVGMDTYVSPWFKKLTQSKMNITHKLVKQESTISTFDASIPQYHLIHSADGQNQNGANQAYRILNKSPTPFLMADEPVAASAQFGRHPIIVTKRKDTERDSTSIYAQNDPWNPILDFNDFIDGENLVDEDLVAWVSMGTYHIPGTEDVPSTPTNWNHYSFFLTPHNYFKECPSVTSSDNTVIRPQKNGKPEVRSFGRSFTRSTSCIPRSQGPSGFDGRRQ